MLRSGEIGLAALGEVGRRQQPGQGTWTNAGSPMKTAPGEGEPASPRRSVIKYGYSTNEDLRDELFVTSSPRAFPSQMKSTR